MTNFPDIAADSTALGRPRDFDGYRVPTILSSSLSWRVLEETGASLARFGDGEFSVISGKGGCAFEGADKELARRLVEVLSNDNPKCLVGLNRAHYYSSPDVLPQINHFVDTYWRTRTITEGHLGYCKRAFYLDAAMTIPRHHYVHDDAYWGRYFDAVKAFFKRRSVLLVTGDDSIQNSEHPLYRECAREVRLVRCPPKEAWREKDRILEDILRVNANGDYTVVLACGPTATVLACELSPRMQALDLGHLAKEYLHFRRRWNPTNAVAEFFAS